MSQRTICFTVELTFQTPILSHTSGAISLGLSASMCRDHAHRPCLPGTLVKGNLRHAWNELQRITHNPELGNIERWLGAEALPDSGRKPRRGSLIFSESWRDYASHPSLEAGRRYRVAINPKTGSVDNGALFIIESPYPSGEEVTFIGQILAPATPQEQLQLERWLNKGFRFIPAMGSLKGSGFGKLNKVRITPREIQLDEMQLSSTSTSRTAPSQTATRFGLRIHPLQPFCFAKLPVGKQNHFAAENFIPGGALVAALHHRLMARPGRWPTLEQELSWLHFTHARPVPAGGIRRPVAVPLSLVKAGNLLVDIAYSPTAHLIDRSAPIFFIDWKEADWNQAARRYNPGCESDLRRTIRIRAAIDEFTGAAKDNQLFSMELIEPAGFDWLANLDIGTTQDSQRVAAELHDLLRRPLMPLGKTKARAEVTLESPYPFTAPSAALTDGEVAIYLQSPAQLLPPDCQFPGTNACEQLHRAYSVTWTELSQGALALRHFYAHQKLYGGDYWWHRFRRPDPDGAGTYHPQILTREGSVFVLDLVQPDRASALIDQWRQRGLPQLQGTPGKENWEFNPWIASNGFGEIAINLKPAATVREDLP